MKTNEVWTTEGAFARNYTMFGMLSFVLFCGLWLIGVSSVALPFLGFLFYLFFLEYNLHKTIEKLLENPSYPVPKKEMIVKSGISIMMAVYCGLYLSPKFSKLFLDNGINLLSTMAKSLVLSLVYFLVFLSVKELVLGLSVISMLSIKKGSFGIAYRVLIIVRTVSVTNYWISYLNNSKCSFTQVFMGKGNTSSTLYAMAKVFFIANLLWDLDIVSHYYRSFVSSIMTLGSIADNCLICNKESNDICYLPCNHHFCNNCLNRALKNHPFCPECNECLGSNPKFSFFDGYISFASIFCCV